MNIRVLLVPYDSGHYRKRMGCGPGHLFERSVGPLLTRLGHAFEVVEITVPEAFPAEIQTAFALCRAVAEKVRECRRNGWFPLVLSGNCNTAIGTVTGCGCATTSVVWFDAHGETTTPETTTSGFLDGMGISILTGQCWRNLVGSIAGFERMPGNRIILVGARDLENTEDELLTEIGVLRVVRIEDLSAAVLAAAASADGSYLHLDLDVLDPTEAVANQWSPPAGLTIGSVVNAVKDIRYHTAIKAAGIASYDPEADCDGRAARAAARILEPLFGEV